MSPRSRIPAIVLSLAMSGGGAFAAPASLATPDPTPGDLGGHWQRTLPPAHTGGFATAFDESRGVWVLAGMGGSATHGEVWTSRAIAAPWSRGEAANRIAPRLYPEFTAWDGPADRLIVLLSAGEAFAVWECSRGTGDTWRSLAAEGEAPSQRTQPVVAFDPAGRRLFVFGGRGRDNQLVDDGLWMLSLVPTPRWSRVTTTGPTPPARISAGVAFDPVRQILVLYGGELQIEGGGVRSDGEDVWFLDLAAAPPVWRLVAETSPGPGWGLGSQVVADPARDRVLTFGGLGPTQGDGVWEMSLALPGTWRQAGSGTPRTFVRTVGHDRDADALVLLTERRARWRLDLATHAWSQIDEGSADVPETENAAWALDPRDGSVLVIGVRETIPTGGGPAQFGHRLSRYVPGEIGRWEPVIASGDPPPRVSGTAVWDSRRRRWIVLGGYDARTRDRAAAWVLETKPALAWRPLPIEGPGPIGDALPALYDRERDRLLVLEEDPATRGVFHDADSRLRVWSLSLDGPPRWTLEAIPGRVPAGRYGAALAFDPRRDRMLLFAGGRRLPHGSSFRDYDDVWALDLAGPRAWQDILAMGNPLPLSVHAGADVDPWHDRLRLIGGLFFRSGAPYTSLFERDSLRTVDLATNSLGPSVESSGFEGVRGGRTIFDPVAGRAFNFGMGSADAWQWTTAPRHDVRVTLGRGARSGVGAAGRGRAPLELVVHGDDRFDPSTIDLASVRATGVAAVALPGSPGGSATDVDADGFADRRFWFVGGEEPAEGWVELRARTHSGVPVIGFARRKLEGGRPTHGRLASRTETTAPSSVQPLFARLLHGAGRGAGDRVSVEGGQAALVEVDLYDVRGRLLWSARRERGAAGSVAIELGSSRAGPGISFVRVRVGGETRVLRHVTLD